MTQKYIFGLALRWDSPGLTGERPSVVPQEIGMKYKLPEAVSSYVNHDPRRVIGDNAVVWSDPVGIWYEVPVVNFAGHQAVRDIESGKLKGSSCHMRVREQEGPRVDVTETIVNLCEVGPVDHPADPSCWVCVSTKSKAPKSVLRRNHFYFRAELKAQDDRLQQQASALWNSKRLAGRTGRPMMQLSFQKTKAMAEAENMMRAGQRGEGCQVNGTFYNADLIKFMLEKGQSGCAIL